MDLHSPRPGVLTVILIALCLIACPRRATGFDYAEVERAIQEKNFAEAQKELESHIQAVPTDYRAYMLLGIVLDEENRPDDAKRNLLRAVQLQPQSASAHINLGKHEARVGDLAHAIEEFEVAIRLAPDDPAGHTNLGLVLTAQGKTAQAVAHFQRVADVAPRDPAVWLNLFKCQLSLKQFAAADTSARRIQSLTTPSAELFGRLGAMQAQAGDYAGAVENLGRSVALDSHTFETRYNLGLAYYRAGNASRATQVLEALAKERENAEVENLLGEVYEHTGESLPAARAFQKAAQIEPSSEAYRFDFIQELLAHRNFEAAILEGTPALRDFPESSRIALALGSAYFGGGHERESLGVFLAAAKKFPDQELPLFFLCLAADTTGMRLAEAEALAEAYMQRHPDYYWPSYFLGHRAYLAARDSGSEEGLKRAGDLLLQSIILNDRYPESHLDMGNVYVRTDQWGQAIKEYQKAIQLEPDLAEAHFRLAQAYAQTGDAARAQTEMEIHKRLLAQQTEKDMSRRVDVFVYKLSH